jgi:hypothetical protein
MDGRDEPDDRRLDDALGRALRRSEDEARPREEFARGLRERFVDGSLEPAAAEPVAPAPRLRISRWVAIPAAATLVFAAAALAGLFEARPVVPVPPVCGLRHDAPPLSPIDAAFAAAEGRIGASKSLAGRTWKRSVVEGRPWLLPAEAAFADGAELKVLSRDMAKADAAMEQAFPGEAGRAVVPVVAVVAPSRREFEALVAPRIEPVPLNEFTIAFSLDDLAVLLVSPGALEPGGPPCEEMDVVHEAVHAWLRARRSPGVVLPLWLDEGLAGAISQGADDTKKWCGTVLSDVASCGMDPFSPDQVLELREYGAMAKQVASRAPCELRPYSLIPAFYAHAESLVLFAMDAAPGSERHTAFRRWLDLVLHGKAGDGAQSVAAGLGFPSVDALFAARDEWMKQ